MAHAFLLKLLRNDSLPLRLRKKIGKAMGTPAPGKPFQIRLFESLFEGKTGNHLDNKIYYYGAHEAATLRLIRGILQKQQSPVYVDVGTNIGQHLMACAPVAKEAYGFEPWERVRVMAQTNLDRNNLGHVKILPFGLGESEAQLAFTPPPENNLGNGSFAGGAGSITLHVRGGDAVMTKMNIAPSVIKIDTEGFEASVLRGLKDTLVKHRPAVIFELGDLSRKDLSSLDTIKAFFPAGYEIFGILPSREKPKLVPYTPRGKYENLLAWPDNNPVF